MRLADAIGDLRVEDPDGEPIAIRSLWNKGPVAILFLRHFG